MTHPYPTRASLEGFETEMFALVASSATPEQWKEWLRVPLEHAAAEGNLSLFHKLIEAGASGSAGWRGCDGRTLLDAAALGGNADIVSGLLRAGSQPDVNVASASSGRSALYTATCGHHEAVAIQLVVAGAYINFIDPIDKRSVLHEAVRGRHSELVRHLVIGGAYVNIRDEYGVTPLHVAAVKGHDGVVSTLLLRGADINALDNTGDTPLIWASSEGSLCVVETLLAAGACFDARGRSDFSALDLAAKKGHVSVIQAILGHGADVNDGCDQGYTALHAAAQYDQADAIDALIEAGADIELKNGYGATPLSHAAESTKGTAMLAILKHGATVSARTNKGDTPLHLACFGKREGTEAVVDLLLRWGADETALNDTGQTPTDMLNVEHWGINHLLNHDEIKRTRLLLSRAPADRVWRRRGWLVMLRSRDSNATQETTGDGNSENDGEGGDRAGGAGADGEGGGPDVPSSMRAAGREYDIHVRHGGGVGDEAGAGGARGDANDAAVLLDWAEMEGTCSTGDENGGGGSGAVDAEERLRVLVPRLLRRGLEGVFRTVVGFL